MRFLFYLLFAISFTAPQLIFAQHEVTKHENAALAPDTVFWQAQRRLKWKDFRGKPNRLGNTVALTSSGLGLSYRTDRWGNAIIDVQCIFYCKNSWVKEDGMTEYILQHEQLHFDITELFARKLRQRILKLNPKERSWQNVQRLYTQVNRECDVYQDRYDGETHHGTLEKSQHKWNTQIVNELNDLVEFASSAD